MPFECTADSLEILTPPSLVIAPNRSNCTWLARPPACLTLRERNLAISAPTIRRDFLPTAVFTVFEIGITRTEKSGAPQVPAFSAR